MNLDHTDKLRRATEIHDKFVDASAALDFSAKQGLKYLSKYINGFLTAYPKANSYQLRALANELLIYWNESITPNTEKFWAELRINNIDLDRKEPLRYALAKRRFKTVAQGIDARNNWTDLKKLKLITEKFTKSEIEQIGNIIANDERNRLEIVKKCLRKKEIPQSQYLKFGDCMAYLINCRLLDKYFSTIQVEELYVIWKNFKSQ